MKHGLLSFARGPVGWRNLLIYIERLSRFVAFVPSCRLRFVPNLSRIMGVTALTFEFVWVRHCSEAVS